MQEFVDWADETGVAMQLPDIYLGSVTTYSTELENKVATIRIPAPLFCGHWICTPSSKFQNSFESVDIVSTGELRNSLVWEAKMMLSI